MTPFKLLNPVYTLDRKELLPAGAVLSEETLDELISNNRDTSRPIYSLLKHGSIMRRPALSFSAITSGTTGTLPA
jgi:hypothetical protein